MPALLKGEHRKQNQTKTRAQHPPHTLGLVWCFCDRKHSVGLSSGSLEQLSPGPKQPATLCAWPSSILPSALPTSRQICPGLPSTPQPALATARNTQAWDHSGYLLGSVFIKGPCRGCREVHLVKCLPCRHEDPGSTPRTRVYQASHGPGEMARKLRAWT